MDGAEDVLSVLLEVLYAAGIPREDFGSLRLVDKVRNAKAGEIGVVGANVHCGFVLSFKKHLRLLAKASPGIRSLKLDLDEPRAPRLLDLSEFTSLTRLHVFGWHAPVQLVGLRASGLQAAVFSNCAPEGDGAQLAAATGLTYLHFARFEGFQWRHLSGLRRLATLHVAMDPLNRGFCASPSYFPVSGADLGQVCAARLRELRVYNGLFSCGPEAFEPLSRLTAASFCHSYFPQGLAALAPLTSVTSLYLVGTRFGDDRDDTSGVARLSALSALKELNLTGVDVGDRFLFDHRRREEEWMSLAALVPRGALESLEVLAETVKSYRIQCTWHRAGDTHVAKFWMRPYSYGDLSETFTGHFDYTDALAGERERVLRSVFDRIKHML